MFPVPRLLFPVVAAVLAAGIVPATAATIALNPTADTYVRNSNPTGAVSTNFGADINFIANNGNGIRVALLRFDLSGITEPITNIKLELTVNIASSGQDYSVYGLSAGEGWTETGVTWTNAPGVVNSYVNTTGTVGDFMETSELYGSGTILSTWVSGSPAGTIDTLFNVSSGPVFDFINADTDKIVTFVIAEPGTTDMSGVGWNSKESATGKPVLTVTTVPEPSAVASLLLGGLLLGQRRRRVG